MAFILGASNPARTTVQTAGQENSAKSNDKKTHKAYDKSPITKSLNDWVVGSRTAYFTLTFQAMKLVHLDIYGKFSLRGNRV